MHVGLVLNLYLIHLATKGRVGIPLTGLTPKHFGVYPKPRPGLPMPYVMVFFCVQLL
jgi:hypothetical protein